MPKKGPSKKEAPARERYSPPLPPSWPPLTPRLPSEELVVETVLSSQILTISNFFTTKLCKTYLNFIRQSISLTTTPGIPKRGEAVRVNDRSSIYDLQFAQKLWEDSGLKDVVEREGGGEDGGRSLWGGEVLGLSPNIRIYRYSKGQFFNKHCKLAPNFSLVIPYK